MIIRQFIKYCLVGAGSFIIAMSVYLIATRFLSFYYLIASLFSFVVSVTWSFFVNRFWTFQKTDGNLKFQYAKFVILSLASLGISTSLLFYFVEFLNIHDVLAQFFILPVVAVFNFSMNRAWTFKYNVNL